MTALQEASTLFDQEQYAEARRIAQAAVEAGSVEADQLRSLKMLIRKCNTHIDDAAAVTPAAPPSAAPLPTVPAPAPAAAPSRPQTVVRHEWFQTADTVTFSFYIKNRTQDQVQIATEPRSLELTIKLDNGSDFQLTHEPLFAEIDPSRTAVAIKQPKVEVVLYKKIPGIHWAALELVTEEAKAAALTTAAPPVAALPATQAQLAYPNSKGKDWSKFKTEFDDKDKPGHLSGDEGLNKLFQDIYRNASEENRRAMMKSYTESGGTVLSTNWEDVGKRRVDGEAPKGMEMKKWSEQGL